MALFEVRGRVLVVGATAAPAKVVAAPLRSLGLEGVDATRSFDSALGLLDRGHALLLLRVSWRERHACLSLVRAVRRGHRPPPVIVSGEGASPVVVAELVREGRGAYVEDLNRERELLACAHELLDPVAACMRAARSLVGHVEMKDALWYLRGLMSREALERTQGNRREAARILGVDRRHVARLADEFQSERFAPRPLAIVPFPTPAAAVEPMRRYRTT